MNIILFGIYIVLNMVLTVIGLLIGNTPCTERYARL